ncbi:MAG: hypothetical protein ABFC34_16570 [Methanobacterium sp.]
MSEEIHLIKFISNFDFKNASKFDSNNGEPFTLSLKLEHGLKIKCDHLLDMAKLISKLDNISVEESEIKLINSGVSSYDKTPNLDSYCFYFHYSINKDVLDKNYPLTGEEIFNSRFQYIKNLINVFRLFKEGDISSSPYYQFNLKNGSLSMQQMGQSPFFPSRNRFILSTNELPKLQELINTVKMPLKTKFKQLKLAFDNYQLSYSIYFPQLQYLTLMNSMEVLFHPSHEGELRNRISRNTAVLLGKTEEESQTIFSNMGKHYDKRSDLVHRGKANISPNDVYNLRHYARESIKEIYKINKEKGQLLKELNSRGFGTRI